MKIARIASLITVLASLAVGALEPAAATAAGAYTVSACSPATSAGAWQQVNTSTAGMSAGNQCGGPPIGPVGGGDTGALYGEDLTGSASNTASGAQAGWSFTAPAGATITAVSYYRSLSTAVGGDDWVAGLFEAGGTPLDTCQSNPNACSSPNNQVPVARSGLSTSSLFFGVECQPMAPDTSCLAGGTQHDAQAAMYSIKVTLSEPGVPTIANLGGPLWSGGIASGTQAVTFAASDPSGISQVAIDGPGGQIALDPQSCDYSQTQPCPELPSGSLAVNTSQLHDGTQTVTLLVTNAAGNTATIQSPPLTVDNNGPPAPANLTATPVGAGSDVIDLSWSNPANPPEPVSGAFAQLCQASCGTAQPLNGSGGAQLTAPGPGTYTIRLWLVDQAGKGSAANAATTSVTVPAAPPSKPPASGTTKHAALKIRTLIWHRGLLVVRITGLPKGAKLHVELEYANRHPRRIILAGQLLRVHTRRPHEVVLRAFAGSRQVTKALVARVR
jgi:hypothetical protein